MKENQTGSEHQSRLKDAPAPDSDRSSSQDSVKLIAADSHKESASTLAQSTLAESSAAMPSWQPAANASLFHPSQPSALSKEAAETGNHDSAA